MQVCNNPIPLLPPSRKAVCHQLGFFPPKVITTWQIFIHKGCWEASGAAHKTLKTLCSCCHQFISQLMQWCLYPVWISVRFYLWQLLLLNFPQKAGIVCGVTVASTLPVAAAAAGLDCVRNKSSQAVNFVPYLCTSCLVIVTQSHLEFSGFAAMSVGKMLRKTQTSRCLKAYKCDWVLLMVVFEGEEVTRGSCSWFSRSEEQN